MSPVTKQAEKAKVAARKRATERRRLKKLLRIEEDFWAGGALHICGVDEAGRGPLAGPVVAAAVIMPPRVAIRGVDDSKLLTPEKREKLAAEIRQKAVAFAVGAASAREIDKLNILRATHLAICRAVSRLPLTAEHVLVDGLPVRGLCEHRAIVDGDRLVHGIACASIIAKTLRDKLMAQLAAHYPGYGWERNAGYGTPEHREAMERLGVTPHHRRSFANLQMRLEL